MLVLLADVNGLALTTFGLFDNMYFSNSVLADSVGIFKALHHDLAILDKSSTGERVRCMYFSVLMEAKAANLLIECKGEEQYCFLSSRKRSVGHPSRSDSFDLKPNAVLQNDLIRHVAFRIFAFVILWGQKTKYRRTILYISKIGDALIDGKFAQLVARRSPFDFKARQQKYVDF